MKTYIPTIAAIAFAATLAYAEGDKEKKPHHSGDRPNPEDFFKKLDTDGSGGVSLAEFQASPKGKENPERAAEYFKHLDANGDGQITKEEFAANRPNPDEFFKKLDTDGSGGVSLAEFQASPKGKENPERAAEYFKKLDANGDGQITKEEFSTRPPHPPGDGKHGDGGPKGPPQGGGGGAAAE